MLWTQQRYAMQVVLRHTIVYQGAGDGIPRVGVIVTTPCCLLYLFAPIAGSAVDVVPCSFRYHWIGESFIPSPAAVLILEPDACVISTPQRGSLGVGRRPAPVGAGSHCLVGGTYPP